MVHQGAVSIVSLHISWVEQGDEVLPYKNELNREKPSLFKGYYQCLVSNNASNSERILMTELVVEKTTNETIELIRVDVDHQVLKL